LEKQVAEIKQSIVSMGGLVEKSLAVIAEVLEKNNLDFLVQVQEIEEQINQLHLDVDALCMKAIATQSPVARDLRFTLAVIKMNADIERMGDQCISISYALQEYQKEQPLAEIKSVREMLVEVQKMVRMALDCFTQNRNDLATDVLMNDDKVDHLRNQINSAMIEKMKKDPSFIPAAMDLIFMARNLERIADHCTNIAEDVIFVNTGRDVRHGGAHES
jgi:phosphate transport system protein